MSVEVRGPTKWVPGTDLRLSRVAASSFTCWTIYPALCSVFSLDSSGGFAILIFPLYKGRASGTLSKSSASELYPQANSSDCSQQVDFVDVPEHRVHLDSVAHCSYV